MFKSLHAKLLTLFLLTAFLPMAITGYISYKSQKKALSNQIEQTLLIFSNNLALNIKGLISEQFYDIDLLAENPVLRNKESSPNAMRNEFKNFSEAHRIYYGAIFVNNKGIITADTDADDTVIGQNLSDRQWFKAAMQGKTYFSDIYLSPVINKPVLLIAGPVKDEKNNIIGVIAPSFNLEKFWETFDQYSSQLKNISVNNYAFLINNEGEIIAHPDRSKILNTNFFDLNSINVQTVKENIENKKLFSNKRNEVFSFSHIEPISGFKNDWYIAISVPKDELYYPLKELFGMYVILFGLVIFISIIAVINLSDYIIKPVKSLVTATSDFAVGRKVSPLKTDKYEEINILNDTFNMMVEKLVERERGHKKSTLILDTIDNGIFAVSKDSRKITTFNKYCEELFNIKNEEVVGKTVEEFCKVSSDFNKFVANSTLLDFINKDKIATKIEFICTLGREKYTLFASVFLFPVVDKDKKRDEILLVFSDITEKRLMERDLIQSEKLNALGQMAAGIVHEVKNPLTTIIGFSQIINNKSNDYIIKEYSSYIEKDANNLNKIVSDFLAFAKPRLPVFIKLNLNDLICSTKIMFENTAFIQGIKISYNLDKNIKSIMADENQLKQVILNIIKNAIEAMDGINDPELRISTGYNEKTNVSFITIFNNGKSMSEEEKKMVGTPFFTTKDKGTGLGMSICYQIVKKHEGKIEIESEPGIGTSFTLYFPSNK